MSPANDPTFETFGVSPPSPIAWRHTGLEDGPTAWIGLMDGKPGVVIVVEQERPGGFWSAFVH